MRPFILLALPLVAAVLFTVPSALAGEVASRYDAEVLQNETVFRVDGTRARLTRRVVVQINNAEGRGRYGRLVVQQDHFRTIRRMSGEIRDMAGNRIQRLRRSDIRDRAGSDGISLYDSYRRRIAELYHDRYPYTLEWEWEIDFATLLHWPSWHPQDTRDPVRHATLEVDVPSDFTFRYNLQNFDQAPAVTHERGRATYRWSTAMPPQPNEPLGPPAWMQRAAIHLAGDRFEIEGYAGSLASWAEFGDWYRSVWNGHWDLPEDARHAVRRLVDGVEDPRERARLVYQFVQSRTRYISVQLGIGGWKPFDAAYVHERRYGDCKALTNYLQALLREVGIESYPALIGHDEPDLDPDFPANRFNHVVLFVPVGQGDPVWLEATSQHLPFGKLGSGSEGRHALVVTPQGGQLHVTPRSSAEMNREQRTVNGRLLADGNLDAQVATVYSGHSIAAIRRMLAATPAQYIDRFWREKFGLPRVTVHSTDQTGLAVTDEVVTLSLDLSAGSYAQVVGRRLLINPNVTNRWTQVPPAVSERKQPVRPFGYSFIDEDSVRLALPEGYSLEIPFEESVIDAGFASYRSSAVVENGEIIYNRQFAVFETELPAESYDDLREFLRQVSRADDRTIVLVRSE